MWEFFVSVSVSQRGGSRGLVETEREDIGIFRRVEVAEQETARS